MNLSIPVIDKRILIGIVISLSGSLLYVLMSILSKSLGKHLATNHLMFLQSITGFLCTVYFFKLKKFQWKKLRLHYNYFYLARAIMSLISIYTFMLGLQFVSIFNALLILNSTPLIIPLLRKIFFKNKIHAFVFPSILLAFLGMILILGPDQHMMDTSIIIIFISMLSMAFSLLLLEKNKTDPNLSLFYYFFFSTIATIFILIFEHPLTLLPSQYALTGMIVGILFFLVQLSLIYSMLYISSQLISVLFYVEIILALFASMLLEDTQFSFAIALGIVFVISGGVGVIFVENKLINDGLNA